MSQLNAGPFYPSGLLDPRYASDMRQLLWTNFLMINEGPGYQRMPSRIGGQPTDKAGPPTYGQHYADALWVDVNRSLWLCTVSGVSGTWVQLELPVLTSNPSSVPVGYRIIRSDLGYATYYWNGLTWVLVSGGGGGGGSPVIAGENITLAPIGPDVQINVSHNPHFVGSVILDYLLLPNMAAPSPSVDTFVCWSEATGVSPNRVIKFKTKGPDGTEVVLSSVIV